MKKVLMILVLGIFVLSFISASITSLATEDNIQCEHNGETYDIGDTFEAGDGCNACRCQAGGKVVCTKMNCEALNEEDKFCGTSTNAECEISADCVTGGCSGSICMGVNEEEITTTCEWKECYNNEKYNKECLCIDNKCQWHGLEQNQIKQAIKERNRLKIHSQDEGSSECPENCTCSGSTIKCQIQERREMTIRAGNSGNTIFQVKGANASTKVELYKSGEKVYGKFAGNQTKEIILPDKVQEKIQQKLRKQNCNCSIELTDEGVYKIQTQKRARLFFLFPVQEKIEMQLNAENGEIIRLKNSWWGFLAKDSEED